MEIHGREITLMRTVGADTEIADMCPDGDMMNLKAFLWESGVYSRKVKNMAQFIAALSRGGETARRYENPGYVQEPLTVDEILALPPADFNLLQEEALNVFMADSKQRVTAEIEKKRRAAVKSE